MMVGFGFDLSTCLCTCFRTPIGIEPLVYVVCRLCGAPVHIVKSENRQ